MASRHERIFTELGLIAEEPPPNPYEILGMDRDFARGLLQEDSKGEGIRFVAAGMYRILSRRYHPDGDADADGDAERFSSIQAAHGRIGAASPAALLRWAKAKSPEPGRLSRLQEQREHAAQRAAELVRMNIAFGRHPQHFSQMEWSQGILAQRGDSNLLIRSHPDGGLRILRGETFALDKTRNPDLRLHTQAFGFQGFMARNRSFGLAPGTKIAAYIDESGRASILAADLSFTMDITGPVTAYREQRQVHDEEGAPDFWVRSSDPLLLTTTVPDTETSGGSEGHAISFPQRATGRGAKNMTWNLLAEVAGTFADREAYKRIRYGKAIGATALSGGSRQVVSYFNMVAVPPRQMIEQDTGYSPLIAPGNSLLLYDVQSGLPVITDTRVVGMIGNGAQN